MKVIKQEIQFDESLKQRIEFIQKIWYKYVEWCSRNFRSLESFNNLESI